MKTFADGIRMRRAAMGRNSRCKTVRKVRSLYAKWKDPTAVLLDSDYNTGLSKKFADIAETPETITAFQRSAIMPDANITNEAHRISTENSSTGLFMEGRDNFKMVV